MNNTDWPYKPGTKLISAYSDSVKNVLEEVEIPMQEVQAQGHFAVSIPLIVKEFIAPALGESEVYEAEFSL